MAKHPLNIVFYSVFCKRQVPFCQLSLRGISVSQGQSRKKSRSPPPLSGVNIHNLLTTNDLPIPFRTRYIMFRV